MLDGKGENQAHIISYMALFCRSAGLCFGFVDFFGGVGWMKIILRDCFYIIDLFIILFFLFFFPFYWMLNWMYSGQRISL